MVFAHPKELPKLKVDRGTKATTSTETAEKAKTTSDATAEDADKLNAWTKAETEVLLQAVQTHGVSWIFFVDFDFDFLGLGLADRFLALLPSRAVVGFAGRSV